MMKISDLQNVKNIKRDVDELLSARAAAACISMSCVSAGVKHAESGLTYDYCKLLGVDAIQTAIENLIDAKVGNLYGQLRELGVDPEVQS